MAAEPKQHPDEKALLEFLAREDQTLEYVQQTADWIRTEYPGSVKTMLPALRALYATKRDARRRSRQ